MKTMSPIIENFQSGKPPLEPTAEAHRRMTRKEKGQKLAEVVQTAYESGRKMYTKDMFREIEVCLSKHSWTKATHVSLPSMIGSAVKVGIPSLENAEPGEPQEVPFPVIYPYRRLIKIAENAFNGESADLIDSDIPDIKRAIFTCPIRMGSAYTIIPNVSYEKVEETWSCIEENWIQSIFRIELVEKLSSVAWFPKVSRVVCLELGHLDKTFADDTVSHRNGSPCALLGYQNYVNHFIALTVAQVLGSRQESQLSSEKAPAHGRQSSLKVAAEDFSYSPQDKRVLAEAGFQILNGHGTSAFRVVDDETVFICCDPRAAVKEVIADIAKPAAMLWIDLLEVDQGDAQGEHWEYIRKKFSYRKYDDSPRTIQLLEQYSKYDIEVKGEALKTELYVRNM